MPGARHARWAALCPAGALGALDAPEARALARHLATCPACRRELAALREATTLLAFAAPPARPPSSVRRALLGHVATLGDDHRTSAGPQDWDEQREHCYDRPEA